MPVATTYIRAIRVKEEPTADDEANRRFKAAGGPDSEVQYPLNRVVHSILLDLYRDQYVIPCAVIELLRDYNPFSTRTGLTKKQVTKYLRILLDQTPELAENIVASLPDGKDLLPPELLARIPPPGNPDTPPIPLSTTPSAISQFIFPPPRRKKSVSRLPAKRQQTNAHEDFVPKVRRQRSIPLVIPLKPPLVQKPDKPVENRDILSFHLHPPPLTPCHKIFTLASFNSSNAKDVLPKDVSTNCLPVASTWVGQESISTPTMPDVMSPPISQPNGFFSLPGWDSGDASRMTSVLPKENINSCGDTSGGQASEKERINQFNFNSMLPALASVVESPGVPRPVKFMKEYDPLLAFGSDKIPRARSLDSVKVSRQFGTPSRSKTAAPPSTTSSQMLPDNLLLTYLANSLKATEEEVKVPKTSCPELVIPSTSSQTKPAQNSPSISQSSVFNFLSPSSNTNSELNTLLSPSFPPPNTFTSPPHMNVSSATPFASPSALHNARNINHFLRRISEQGSPTTLATGEDEIASLFLANSLPKSSNDIQRP